MHKVCWTVAFSLAATYLSAQTIVDQTEQRFEAPREARSTSGKALPSFDPLSPPPAADGVSFVLGGIRLEGSTAVPLEIVDDAYSEQIGTEIPVSELFAIANRITAIYGQNGYPLSRAVIPAQEIGEDGAVTIRIVEGYVDRVTYEGIAKSNRLVRQHGQKLQSEQPLKAATLERNLLLADDLPGLSVESVLARSEENFGATTVILNGEPEAPYRFTFSVDNRGTDAVGPWQLDLGVAARNLLAENSETSLRIVNASLSDELLYATVEHLQVLNSHGTTFSFGGRFTNSRPGTPTFVALELETSAQTVWAELRHPVIRSRSRNLDLYASIEARDSETLSLGTQLSRDQIRSARFGMDFDNADQTGGRNTVSVELSLGIDGLGANPTGDPLNSRAFGEADYAKINIDVSRRQDLGTLSPLMQGWSFLVKGSAQLADGPLLSSEECSVGGSDYSRAFDPSTLSGDRCYALGAELAKSLDLISALDQHSVFVFAEFGSATNIDPGSLPGSDTIASLGLGTSFSFNQNFSGTIELAQQARNTTGSGKEDDPRLYVSFSGEF